MMAIIINTRKAKIFLREQAQIAKPSNSSKEWIKHIQHISELCESDAPKTHIAFLGAAILAKSLNTNVDLYAIKPRHELNKGNPRAFSIRPLAHNVLVEIAAEQGFSLGVSGREPLNNQPYFRMGKLGDDTPIHPNGREVFNYLLKLIENLSKYTTQEQAAEALRAFIVVRRKYLPSYIDPSDSSLLPGQLLYSIKSFVSESSEGGKRAQAVAAGLMDAWASPDRVESGRINDPSRHYPGDVCIYTDADKHEIEKAIEVKDKIIKLSDIQIFGKKCLEMGVKEAAVLMTNSDQKTIDQNEVTEWAEQFGINITLFHGWDVYVTQALFWSETPSTEASTFAANRIHLRLIEIQAAENSIAMWKTLVGTA